MLKAKMGKEEVIEGTLEVGVEEERAAACLRAMATIQSIIF